MRIALNSKVAKKVFAHIHKILLLLSNIFLIDSQISKDSRMVKECMFSVSR